MTLVIALHQVEGEEADKVLAFFPRDVKPNNQSAVVGLVQAMLAFSSIGALCPDCLAGYGGEGGAGGGVGAWRRSAR